MLIVMRSGSGMERDDKVNLMNNIPTTLEIDLKIQ